jgi:UDP-glucose 4-epimerase
MIGNKPVVLITGANGFVGRNLSHDLKRAGWTVRRALRSPSQQGDIFIESIGPDTDWHRALEKIDAVIHLAARVHHPKEEHARELYQQINSQGTLKLATTAAQLGVQKFIYLSTILVNGGSTDRRSPFRHDDEVSPRGVYGISKAEAERGLERLSSESTMEISIVRSPLIYGPGARGNFQLLVKALKFNLPLPLASIRNRRAFVSVQNLNSFLLSQLSRANEKKFTVYLIADAEQISTPQFVTRIAKAMNLRARLFPFSIRILGSAFCLLGRSELRDSLIGSLEVDISSALSTGWRHVLTMDEGLKIAVSSPS